MPFEVPAAGYAIAFAVFLVGSIPAGLIISRIFYHTDIRRSGSGNIGAMNALRTIGKTGAAVVLVFDMAKGLIPAALVIAFFHDLPFAALIAACAVLGHCFSPWLRFKGGKGVATSFGALFALCWPAGVAAVLMWLAGALVTTYSSVGSVLALLAAPLALWYFTRDLWVTAYGVFAAALIVYTHRQNLARLRSGQEQGIPFLRRNPRGS